MEVGCSLRRESKGLEIRSFGWRTWVGGDSIYQDGGQRKEEGGTHSGTLSFDEKDNVDLPN